MKLAYSALTGTMYIVGGKEKVQINENFKDVLVHYLWDMEGITITHKGFEIKFEIKKNKQQTDTKQSEQSE